MPPFGPVKRRDLVRFLLQAGYHGPFSGGRHQFMVRGEITLRIPNPHQGDIISRELLSRLLKQAGLTKREWEAL